MPSVALDSAIRHLDDARTTPELVQATKAVCALQDPAAAPTLIKVLGYNNPAVAAVATQGLVALGRAIVPTLLTSLDAQNYGARAWVVRVIAALRDPRGLELLDRALQADIAPSVRRAATRGLAELDLVGSTAPADLSRCCHALFRAAHDDEWVVRYAAAYGLEQRLSVTPPPAALAAQGRALLQNLSEEGRESVKVVRLRAQLALQRLSTG